MVVLQDRLLVMVQPRLVKRVSGWVMVVDALDVVGITERMDESIVLFAERWQLPLHAVQQSSLTAGDVPGLLPASRSQSWRSSLQHQPQDINYPCGLYIYLSAKQQSGKSCDFRVFP